MRFARAFKLKTAWKDFFPAFFLVANSLIWYTLTYAAFKSAIENLHVSAIETMTIFTAYYVAIASSAILGAVLFSHKRERCLLSWLLAGTVTTAMLIAIPSSNTPINTLISLFLGISIGIGLPSCLAYFADATFIESRGFHGGIVYAAVGLGTIVLVLLINSIDSVLAFATLAVWRAIGLVVFHFSRSKGKAPSQLLPSTYGSILGRRDMILYLIPWIMFSLVNFIDAPILENQLGGLFSFVGFVEVALSGFFALLGGLLADLIGRKRVVITGFIVLGIEYAVLSLFFDMLFSWSMFTVLDSLAWGLFASVFFMTLWGDLGENHEKEKYYALGGLPYLLAGFLPIIIKPYVGMIGPVTAFSLASFFLFLAVLPLMYAPETLPEKNIRERELRDYVEKAKRVKQKPV